MAEVDGNRTRQTRFARLNCFEGSGTHQAYGHLPFPPGVGRPFTVADASTVTHRIACFVHPFELVQ